MNIWGSKINNLTSRFITYCRQQPDALLLQALAFSLPFERLPSLNAFGISLRFSLLFGGLLILRVAWRLLRGERPQKLSFGHFTLGLFMLWQLLLIPGAVNLHRAFQVLVFTGFTMVTGVAAMYTWSGLKAAGQQRVIRTLYAAAIVVALFGIYQYLGDFFRVPTSWTGLAARYSGDVFGFARIQSTALEPLYYASFLLLPTLLFISQTLFVKSPSRWTIPVIALFVTSLALTLSRGAIFGFLGALVLAAVLAYRYRTKLQPSAVRKVALGLGVGLIIALAAIQIFHRSTATSVTEGKEATVAYVDQLTTTGTEGSGDDRARFRREAWALSTSNSATFLFGIGPGQFGPYFQNNQSTGEWAIVNNLPLEILLETGFIGLLILCSFFSWLVWGGWRSLESAPALRFWLTAGFLAYFLSQAIQYQTFSTLYIVHIWLAIGIFWGVVYPASFKQLFTSQ